MTELLLQSKFLWGKKKIQDDQEYWVPLIAHLMDTKNVMNWLYVHWISDGTRKVLCQDITNEEMKKLVNFLGFFHDYGKASPAFQAKSSRPRNEALDTDMLEKLIQAGFKSEDFEDVNPSESPHPLVGEALLENVGLNEFVGAIIGGHHGKPARESPVDDQIYGESENVFGSDENDKIWQKVQNNILEYGLELCGYQTLTEIPKIDKPQAVILEGLLIMADWFASSEYLNNSDNIPLFPLITLDQNFEDLNLNVRYKSAIENWLVNDEWMPEYIASITEQYKKRFGFTPRPLQKEMSQIITDASDPGLIIIEAPTGIGKTELALTAAEQLAFKKGENGLYLGLPTQATTNAMFSRIETWLDKISKEQRVKSDIKLQQGKAEFNQEYKHLQKAENVDDDEGAVVVNSWFSGKKSSLVHFSVGTIDNLLLMGLKQKHLFLRHLGFSGKVVIIDEIHAYDIYMSSYLEKAVEWLGAYNIPVIALSATLPKAKRNDLLRAYYSGKYGTKKIRGSQNWQDTDAYPLLSMLDGKKLVQVYDFKMTNDEIRKVEVIRLQGSDDDLINKALSTIEDGGIAGMIVNTVKRAQQLAEKIPKEVPVLLFHSAFLASDREKIEENLQKLVGKNANRPKKMIVIGTQVLEQSLDIDFDVLFTDIAPMDLLIQRIGRLQRHQISRPMMLANPKVFISGINKFGDYGKANEYIYDKYLLMKTDMFLKDYISIPNDVSKLVQSVYDLDDKTKDDQLSAALRKFKNKMEKSKNKASMFQISDPKKRRMKDIHGWLDDDKENVTTSERAAAAVRDIQETIEVILVKHTKAGDFLIDGRPLDRISSENIAEQTIRLPVGVVQNIDQTIKELEKRTSSLYSDWQNDLWLHGAIALPLDENNETTLNGFNLHYSTKMGLFYEKEESDD